MDAELKRKWVEALRSGKYQQGKSALRCEDQFCCLGVLCDISGAGQWNETHHGIYEYVVRGNSSRMGPPEPWQNSIGLRLEESGELWRMNDIRDKSFAEIADYIEQYL